MLVSVTMGAAACSAATPAATACYAAAEDKDIPVVFTAITDPVGAKLDSGNITGTSLQLGGPTLLIVVGLAL